MLKGSPIERRKVIVKYEYPPFKQRKIKIHDAPLV
jgi:hypothetical protein